MVSSEFWAMGGYARYVWPCFGFAAVVLAWNVLAARAQLAAARKRTVRAISMDADVLGGVASRLAAGERS